MAANKCTEVRASSPGHHTESKEPHGTCFDCYDTCKMQTEVMAMGLRWLWERHNRGVSLQSGAPRVSQVTQ